MPQKSFPMKIYGYGAIYKKVPFFCVRLQTKYWARKIFIFSLAPSLTEGWRYQITFFGKFTNGRQPPLICGRLCSKFFVIDIDACMQGGMMAENWKCMHMISRVSDHSEGWGWGSTAVWNLSENLSCLLA